MSPHHSLSLLDGEQEKKQKDLIYKMYPKKVKLRGGPIVELRLLREDDLDELFGFFQRLPDNIRLYLRSDVNDRDAVARRMKPCDRLSFFRIAVLDGARIIAEGGIYKERFSWKQHLGEIRVIIDPAYQHKGLGTALIRELYEIAQIVGIQVLFAHIVPEQQGAVKILQKLGFKIEVTKKDHVRDLHTEKHDLMVMTCNLHELWKRLESLMFDLELGRGLEAL
jgi:RimJ/RimL family protein N-acetyltransferase